MSYTPPRSVEAFLTRRPTMWALVTELLGQLSSLETLRIDASMAGVSTGEASYPVFSFEFRQSGVLAFRISIANEIDIRFMTVADRARFEARYGECEITLNAAKHASGRRAHLGLDKEVMIRCEGADRQALAEALTIITSTTPMRQLIPRPADPHIIALMKQLYSARDAYKYEAFSEEIAETLTDNNLDHAIDLVAEISPWADEDARNVADTKFLLLYEAIYEQKRHLPSAVRHLLSLRSEFEEFGGDALEDVQEIDDLLEFLKGTTH